jgi:D-alanyl-D-alanine carboxypeptidase
MQHDPRDRRPARGQGHVRQSAPARSWPAALALVGVGILAGAIAIALISGWGPGTSGPVQGARGSLDGTPVAYQGTAAPSEGASRSATPDASTAGSATPGDSASPAASPSDSGGSPAPSAAPGASGQPAAIPAHRLQARLDALRARGSLPGVSVAIVWDDGRVWTGTSGSADVAAGRSLTKDSGFALASISKTFTAAVVLQLVEEGRLKLDAPVAPLLPAYRLNRRITVRMLLDHTSGLPDFFFNPTIDARLQSKPDATWTAQDSWALVARKRPRPGTVWAYSNTNYLLLGELVQAVTGRSLAREVRTRLLAPLGLTDTWYQVVEKPRTSLTRGYRVVATASGGVRDVAVARASDVMPFRSVISAAGGAGSIASTALDTARWMQAFAGGRVLSPTMQAAMLADIANTRKLHPEIPYGLGIQRVELDGHPALGHSGRYLGYRNVVRYLPDEGLTIAVLTNQGVYDPARIAKGLLRIVLPPSPAPSGTPARS